MASFSPIKKGVLTDTLINYYFDIYLKESLKACLIIASHSLKDFG
ncbi:hypothetical protein LMG8520_0846 [Lactococcus lactis subsp. lactis]|uniref:Uncharacterized protein n=1 Tax=Lactococcus lactis subsp. lactis TaxID=1360 RepID=A0A0V8DCA1_LACLL|nr:hypothetical protein LMG8520_0846 [Lactococcus lactis subsp. lactis]